MMMWYVTILLNRKDREGIRAVYFSAICEMCDGRWDLRLLGGRKCYARPMFLLLPFTRPASSATFILQQSQFNSQLENWQENICHKSFFFFSLFTADIFRAFISFLITNGNKYASVFSPFYGGHCCNASNMGV